MPKVEDDDDAKGKEVDSEDEEDEDYKGVSSMPIDWHVHTTLLPSPCHGLLGDVFVYPTETTPGTPRCITLT
jgi:hypothetical protein